jgi:alpha-N-arabinofuranosidase
MKRRYVWLLLPLAALILVAVLRSGTADEADVTCQVDAAQVANTISRGLFGTNLEWYQNGDGIWNGGVDPQYITVAAAQGLSLIRFPGGTFSDLYHWVDGTGPIASRPVRPDGTDPGSSPNNFGTPELAQFTRGTGAAPLLTVNAGTGTAGEAAGWVAYCNSAGNAARAADGFPAPLGVQYWEVGNELYLNGAGVEQQLTVTPDVYAARFLSFATAMRAVDPTIKLLAIGIAQSYAIPFGPYTDWDDRVLSQAAAQVDYVAVHNAYFPFVLDRTAASRTVYQAMWAAPESVDQSLTALEQLITRYEAGRATGIGIAITEWGPFFSASFPEWTDQVATLGSAVFVARILQVFLAHPRVQLANCFKFTQAFMGWVDESHRPKFPYYALQLFTKHFGTRRVPANVISPMTQGTPQFGMVPSLGPAPEVTAAASLSDSGDRLYINLINRSWDTSHRVAVNLQHFTPAQGNARLWLLSGSSATSTQAGISSGRWTPGTSLTVAPHSVVTIEMASR